MSSLPFASRSAEEHLAGPERHWLLHLAFGPSITAWDLDMVDNVDRAARILSMVPEVPEGEYGANYLHRYLHAAQEQKRLHAAAWKSQRLGTPTPANLPRYDPKVPEELIQALRRQLGAVGNLEFHVAGHVLHHMNVALNTALAAGSDPMRLATKLQGWSHCLIEGPDRAWVADIIDEGLAGGMFRRGTPGVGDMRWEKITAMLRERDDEAVVTSHSTGSSFPSRYIAGLVPPWPVPGDREADDAWQQFDQLPENIREAYQGADAQFEEQWEEMTFDDRWNRALAGLRKRRPWSRLAPETLKVQTFGPAVTAYDLLASDREERVRAAVAAYAPAEAPA